MKKILLCVLFTFLSFSIFSQDTEVIMVYDQEYNIVVPDNMDELKTDYLRAMNAYLEEKVDFEKLDKAFEDYKESAEESIISKDFIIDYQKKLIAVKDKRIKELQNGWFSVIPSVYYSISPTGSGGGGGIGILLFDSFFIQALVGYPLEARFSVGWKF